jgi:hypothetical protein
MGLSKRDDGSWSTIEGMILRVQRRDSSNILDRDAFLGG